MSLKPLGALYFSHIVSLFTLQALKVEKKYFKSTTKNVFKS